MRSRCRAIDSALAAIADRRIRRRNRAVHARRSLSRSRIRRKIIDDTRAIKNDEGPRADTTLEALAKLKTGVPRERHR